MAHPLVSIITPVFNAEKYLLLLANNVLAQTYENWEWIIVDDGSTDNSHDVLKGAASKDKRIKVYKNEANFGAFRARNNALEIASGEFIAFLDADDLWESDKLKLQIELMQQNNYWFTYTDFDRFINDYKTPFRKENLPSTATYKKILTNNYIATSTVIIWRAKAGDFYLRNVYYDDFMLWLELLRRIEVAYKIPHNLMHYRLTSGSLSINKFKSAKEVFKMFTEKMEFGYLKGSEYFVKWVVNTAIRYIK